MSRKNRNRGQSAGKGPGAVPAARLEVERLIQKRSFKDALKQAKICFRLEESADHRRLLERAYLMRIQELERGGMRSEAAELAGHLLEFGVGDPEVMEAIAGLLPALGLGHRAAALAARLGSPEVQEQLIVKMADQAVLHSERVLDRQAELREGARRVRAALEALDAGDEAGGMAKLQDVPRSSPFADWRYFVRGLAAFRRDDAAQSSANWERLDPQRAASRIARSLRALRDAGAQPAGAASPALAIVEKHVFGEAILEQLERLPPALQSNRWKEVSRLIEPIFAGLRRFDRGLARRLTGILLEPVLKAADREDEGDELLEEFCEVAEPVERDPKWNRLQAIYRERDRRSGQAADFWNDYARDLERVADLPAEENRKLRACVLRRVATLRSLIADEAEMNSYEAFDADKSVSQLKDQTLKALEESLRLEPNNQQALESLFGACTKWGRTDEAAQAAYKLLEHFPDHFDALVFLADYHCERNETDRALPLIERTRTLKPLDEERQVLETRIREAHARRLALSGRCDEARNELARVDRYIPAANRTTFLARQAALEFKAGQAQRAEELIAQASGLVEEPASVWLAMAIEAPRYELPRAIVKRFAGLVQVALAQPPRSETGGRLAALLRSFFDAGDEYPGRDQHVKGVLKYLRRAEPGDFHLDDLLAICEFLKLLEEDYALLETLLEEGLRKYPDCPKLLWLDARHQFEYGPSRADPGKIVATLERVLELVKDSHAPDEASIAQEVRAMLSHYGETLREFARIRGEFRSPDRRRSGSPLSMLFRAFQNMNRHLDDDDEDSDDGFSLFRRPRQEKQASRRFG